MKELFGKVLGIAMLFGFIFLMKFFDENFLLYIGICVALYLLLIFHSYKTLTRNLNNLTKYALQSDAAKGLIIGGLILCIPIYNVSEAYKYAFNGTNETIVIKNVTEMICKWKMRKSSSWSEEPCWVVKFKVEDYEHERKFFTAKKKGETFNVNYVPGNPKDIKYEDPIRDKWKYVNDAFGSFSMLMLLISLFMISNAILKFVISSRVKTKVPVVVPPPPSHDLLDIEKARLGKDKPIKGPDGRIEPKF